MRTFAAEQPNLPVAVAEEHEILREYARRHGRGRDVFAKTHRHNSGEASPRPVFRR